MLTSEERKKQLIAQGALYRAEVLAAKATVSEALQPASLASNLLQHVARSAMVALRGGVAGGPAGLQTVLPLLLSGVSALARKPRMKPLLGLVLGAATAGAAAYLGLRSRKPKQADDAAII
jgi:hypothetical protein